MKPSDLMRPDKIILEGFKSLSNIGLSQYSNQKSEAKAKSQLTFIGKKKMEVVKTQLIEFCSDDYSMKENIRDFSFINAPESQKIKTILKDKNESMIRIKKNCDFDAIVRLKIKKI